MYYLLRQLPKTRYWVVYLDSFYTSLPLLGRLRHDLSIGACGTARPSAGFPPELKISKSEVRQHEYHSLRTTTVYDALFQQPVGVSSWIDNAPVTVMSTVHEL